MIAIRSDNRSLRNIAKDYCVSYQTIWNIKNVYDLGGEKLDT